MAEVSKEKSSSVAFGKHANSLLGIAGGSSHPIGTYSRRSELTSGITKNDEGRTFTTRARRIIRQFLRWGTLAGLRPKARTAAMRSSPRKAP